MKTFSINDRVSLVPDKPFLIAGPCVLESDDVNMRVAEGVAELAEKYGFTYIFKASFDKANRTSLSSYRGSGMEEGLRRLRMIGERFNLPTLTDIHESWQALAAAEAVDILQIPAFLCRQTDLLLAAGKTGKAVNIKKAQFLSAADMANVIKKVESTGNEKIMLTERGTMFGYNNLVVDFRNVVDMGAFGYPVVMDATHSTQRPGSIGNASGGDPRYAPYLAQAAALCGASGFFFEVHPDPSCALSDATTMIRLDEFGAVLQKVRCAFDLARL
ncbi:MAG: 3-deoxy-8-phosphooctulonate synthase [Campylobacterales bacterium]